MLYIWSSAFPVLVKSRLSSFLELLYTAKQKAPDFLYRNQGLFIEKTFYNSNLKEQLYIKRFYPG
ncbi:hypothetical protein GT93_00840 [Pseudomonas plecoglossicida]|nr:hypothetical protein GT93_00840 [Pseudomonas plecoglossicida]